MKSALRGLGTVLMFFGLVWILHGLGVLPGGVAAGETHWAVYGAISFVAGLAVFVVAVRRDGSTRQAPRR